MTKVIIEEADSISKLDQDGDGDTIKAAKSTSRQLPFHLCGMRIDRPLSRLAHRDGRTLGTFLGPASWLANQNRFG
jgi:hypothetical protein